MSTKKRYLSMLAVLALFGIALVAPEQAHATAIGGNGLPWERPIGLIADSLTGPVAIGLCLIGFFGGTYAYATGGEMNGWVRSLGVMALAGAVLLALKPFISSVFGVGAILP